MNFGVVAEFNPFHNGHKFLIDYLKENYGIQIDEERYTVFYEVQGSNLMPNITVMETQLAEAE